MPAVLTTGSALTCPHHGTVSLQASERLLTVDGQAVVTRADVLNGTVAGCTNQGGSNKPCLKIVTIAAGVSTTLRLGHEFVALATAQGLTDSSPPGTWQVSSANQTKLEAT
jgi:hypothetical protein